MVTVQQRQCTSRHITRRLFQANSMLYDHYYHQGIQYVNHSVSWPFLFFMSFCQQLVMSTKACAKCCLRWCVCVGFLRIGWFPDLILHPTLVIFILLCRTNWDPYLNMKCFVAIPANLFIGVSHINALHNWPTGRLFHIRFPRGRFHALTALFLLFLAFLDNQKEVEPSRLAESWSCPSVSSYLLSRVLFFCFFLFIFPPLLLVVEKAEPEYAASLSPSCVCCFSPPGSESMWRFIVASLASLS